MKVFFVRSIFFFLAIFLLSPSSWGEEIAVVADLEFEDTVVALRNSLDFIILRDRELREDLCRYPKLLVLGPESYLRVRDRSCPGQKRYLGGILYPALLEVPAEVRLISPLPSCNLLRRYGKSWVVIHSRYLEYYLEHLRKCFFPGRNPDKGPLRSHSCPSTFAFLTEAGLSPSSSPGSDSGKQ